MQTIIDVTYMVQFEAGGRWEFYIGTEFLTHEEAEEFAGRIFDGKAEARVVTVTKTVKG